MPVCVKLIRPALLGQGLMAPSDQHVSSLDQFCRFQQDAFFRHIKARKIVRGPSKFSIGERDNLKRRFIKITTSIRKTMGDYKN
jgi:hypothetical protein